MLSFIDTDSYKSLLFRRVARLNDISLNLVCVAFYILFYILDRVVVRTTYVDAAYCYRRSSVVCPSVGLS